MNNGRVMAWPFQRDAFSLFLISVTTEFTHRQFTLQFATSRGINNCRRSCLSGIIITGAISNRRGCRSRADNLDRQSRGSTLFVWTRDASRRRVTAARRNFNDGGWSLSCLRFHRAIAIYVHMGFHREEIMHASPKASSRVDYDSPAHRCIEAWIRWD